MFVACTTSAVTPILLCYDECLWRAQLGALRRFYCVMMSVCACTTGTVTPGVHFVRSCMGTIQERSILTRQAHAFVPVPARQCFGFKHSGYRLVIVSHNKSLIG